MSNVLRCRATTMVLGDRNEEGISPILGSRRCMDAVDHKGAHVTPTPTGLYRWTFAHGSYTGLSEDHPEFTTPVCTGADASWLYL